MKVAISGGSGFVGTHLSRHLLNAGHEVTALGTRMRYRLIDHDNFFFVSADTTQPGSWQDAIEDADWIFNLAGRTIFKRWTRRYKQEIYNSRILTTRNLVAALPANSEAVFVSTSAVGYYGSCGDTKLTESSPRGTDFLADVAEDWEAEANAAKKKGSRVAIARFGIVLGADGGALAKMVPAFKAFVGGPLGNGRQWFPWIHIQDVVAALEFMASGSDMSGSYNLCAPHPVRNGMMSASLGRILDRPAAMAVPTFMLRVMMGELAGVLLGSQRAIPSNLLAAGFQFTFPELEGALEHLVS